MLKKNVFGQSRVMEQLGMLTKVFAVRIGDGLWAYIRFRGGVEFGFLPVYSTGCGMPRLDWRVDPERWFAFEFSGPEKYDADDYVLVGRQAMATPGMPQMYQRPSSPRQPWMRIESNGSYVRVNGPQDVAGLQERVRLNPRQIAAFLRGKYEAGELKRVDVDAPESVPLDPAAEQLEREAPTIVFAKIVQPIDPDERERVYEKPLAEFLANHNLGEITGGGTMQDKDGSVRRDRHRGAGPGAGRPADRTQAGGAWRAGGLGAGVLRGRPARRPPDPPAARPGPAGGTRGHVATRRHIRIRFATASRPHLPPRALQLRANGNRTLSGYVTGDDDRLSSDGTYNYTHDDEGNRTSGVNISTGAVREYAWDHRNRLTDPTFRAGR